MRGSHSDAKADDVMREIERILNADDPACPHMRKCITLPPISEWYDAQAFYPHGGEVVFGLVREQDGATYVSQVRFHGTDWAYEYILHDRSVHVSHWLHIGATGKADTIDEPETTESARYEIVPALKKRCRRFVQAFIGKR